ncbi:MAG TPA: VOC family protein [Ktedonobacterales bacterium]
MQQDTIQDQPDSGASPSPSIHPATQIGPAALTFANLDRSITFYTDALGLALLERNGSRAVLGAGTTPLLLLTEQAGAKPFPGYGATGLYHFAVLVPTRADLGRWLRHWLELGLPMPGQGDHLVSEALYLSDLDGNGIEIYRDRPRAEWTWEGGRVRMATDPVDIRGLLELAEAEGQPWEGMPQGTRLGHIHLQVGDIAAARRFYHDILGFDVTAQLPGALFVSAGGYHHHIGLNTWQSRGAPPAPEGTAGLRFYNIELPVAEALAAVVARLDAAGIPYERSGNAVIARDPFSNRIALRAGAVTDVAAANAIEG